MKDGQGRAAHPDGRVKEGLFRKNEWVRGKEYLESELIKEEKLEINNKYENS